MTAKDLDMTNEEIYESVMGHLPNTEFGARGSFTWEDISAIIDKAKEVKSEQLVCDCIAFHKSDECYKLGCKKNRSTKAN